VNQVSTFNHPELIFQELVNLESSFRVLLKGVFLKSQPKILFREYF
jgi:hypothetical protein